MGPYARVTLDFSRPGKPTDNSFIESLIGNSAPSVSTPTGSSTSTRRDENARLGVETTTRCSRTARSAIKCLQCFMGGAGHPGHRTAR